MDVRMDQQGLGPGMQRCDNAGFGSHIPFIAKQLKKGIPRTRKQYLCHQPGIEMPQKSQLFRYCKYDMKMIAA